MMIGLQYLATRVVLSRCGTRIWSLDRLTRMSSGRRDRESTRVEQLIESRFEREGEIIRATSLESDAWKRVSVTRRCADEISNDGIH